MKKGIVFVVMLLLFLCSCSKISFENPVCERFETVEQYNTFVKEAAKTTFDNYFFIDLRSNEDYRNGYISNFHSNYHFPYEDDTSLDLILSAIEKDNKAGYTAPIVLLDSGRIEDEVSTIVYEKLIALGYSNVKDVILGHKGLKEAHQTGFPYSLRDGSDCGCD